MDFMRLNILNNQIFKELDINTNDCQYMTFILGEAVFNNKPKISLGKEVEINEVYIVCCRT